MEALGGGGDLDVGTDRGGGVAAVGVMRRQRRGTDGRRNKGRDVHPPVVPGDDLDRPAVRVACQETSERDTANKHSLELCASIVLKF